VPAAKVAVVTRSMFTHGATEVIMLPVVTP